MEGMPTTPSPADLALPEDIASIEAAYTRLVRRHGRPGPGAKRLDLQTPVLDDGHDDCWTHAWNVAGQQPGRRYVEGICVRGQGVAQHAWVEEDTIFGPGIVECTPGYEDAHDYYGITVNHAPQAAPAQLTGDWDLPRASVIQALIGGGHSLADVLRIIA